MAKSRVVLATGDEWIANLIGAVLRDADLEVLLAPSAEEALAVLQTHTDAIIADAALPDDATWLVSQLRQSSGPSASIPFLLLAHADDSFSRMEALRAGADVCLTKPFRADELCLQLLAILAMYQRLGASVRLPGVISTRNVTLRTPPPPASPIAALSGDLALVSLATVLSLLELERRSGTMVVRGPKQVIATLSMREGAAARATLAGASTSIIAVLRRMLRWKTGHFEFSPDDINPASIPPNQHSIGALLIEAARLDDETPSSRRMDSILPPSGEDGFLAEPESLEPMPTPRVSIPPVSVRPPSRVAPRRASVPPPGKAASVLPPKPPPPTAAKSPVRPAPAAPVAKAPPSKSTPPRPGPPRPGPPRPRGSGGG
jgi:two-component system OmpR family response regulator